MPTLHLAELTFANRPSQLPLLSRLADILATSPAVTHLMVRGSLATERPTASRTSTSSSASRTPTCPRSSRAWTT